MPRVLGLGDRQQASKTYGCFDRSYWHYRLSDFPSAWFQSACHLLALAHAVPAEDNPFFGSKNVRAWSLAAARFGLEKAHRDGSVDEAYPNEHSYCATAFLFFHVTETWLRLKTTPERAAAKTAEWLMNNGNPQAANQDAAAIAGLRNFAVLTGKDVYRQAAEEKYVGLARRQPASGYLPEYDGYDIGYLSRTLSLFARGMRTPDKTCVKALEFLESRIDDAGQFSVEGTSRRTQYLYPYAFAAWDHPVLTRLEKGLSLNRVIRPGWLDDRYAGSLAIDYLEAYAVQAR